MFNSRMSSALIIFNQLAEWLAIFNAYNALADNSAST
jgi:hypothetical protein